MSTWLKDLGPVERDGSHILLTRKQWDFLDKYNGLLQPTDPSSGRCWGTVGGAFCWVEDDPKHPDGSYVIRKSLPALVID